MVKSLLILAGGNGTRLKEITGAVSKPLVKVGREAVITIVINKMIRELSISKIYLLIQEKHLDQYNHYLNTLPKYKKNIELVAETTKLGTGGAIKAFLSGNDIENFYVSNADTIIRSDISSFRKADINSILCTRMESNTRFGSLKVDKNNNIMSFVEKKLRKIQSLALVFIN